MMNQEKIFVIPGEGLLIRDPQTREQLPSEGKEVVNSTYWNRRIKDGDATIGKKPKVKLNVVKNNDTTSK